MRGDKGPLRWSPWSAFCPWGYQGNEYSTPRGGEGEGGMERALTLFLGNGYSCFCSAGVTIVLIRGWKKILFKRPALSAGLRHHVAGRASRSAFKHQRSLKTGKIKESKLISSEHEPYICAGEIIHKKEKVIGPNIPCMNLTVYLYLCLSRHCCSDMAQTFKLHNIFLFLLYIH